MAFARAPLKRLACRLVVAVDLAVVVALLSVVGGVLAGACNVLIRGAALLGESFDGQSRFVWEAFAQLAVVVPVLVVGAACTSAFLRSRFRGTAVWFGVYILYITSYFASTLGASLAWVVRLLPIGSASALASGEAWAGNDSTSTDAWLALGVTAAWVTLFAALGTRRARSGWASEGKVDSGTRQRKVLGLQLWSVRRDVLGRKRAPSLARHLVVGGCLAVSIGVGGLVGAERLSAAGLSSDIVYQTLTDDLRSDYLEHLADLLGAGDFQAARELVGPSGWEGLAAIESDIKGAGGSAEISRGSVGDGVRDYGALHVDLTGTDALGGAETVTRTYFVDLRFEIGSWLCLGIRLWS
jgi:hypothetical protein